MKVMIPNTMVESKIDTCRVCLQTESTKCVSLFDNYKEDVVSEHIKSIAAVEIDADDELPQGICPECLLQLDNALEFKRKCLLSDQILRNGALKQEIEIDDEPIVEDIKVEINVNNPLGTIKEENESLSDDDVTEPTEHLDTEDAIEDTTLVERKSKAIDLKLMCDDCGGSFKSKCKLKVHWKKVHLPEKLTCHLCKRMFKNYKSFNVHQKTRTRSCLIASKVKVEVVGKIRIFHCTFCSYKNKNINNVDAHLITHTRERRFQCNICGKSYSQLNGLMNHNISVHKDDINSISCYICGKVFNGRTRVNEHIRRIHFRNTPSKCTICNKVFKSQQVLTQHMVRHTNIKAFTCEICGKVFYSNSECLTHKKTVHGPKKDEIRKYKCELCEFRTKTRKFLVKHASKHTDTNIPCLICGHFFDDVLKYNAHKKRHEESKYPCPHCDKAYGTAKSRGYHVRTKHKPKKIKEDAIAALDLKQVKSKQE